MESEAVVGWSGSSEQEVHGEGSRDQEMGMTASSGDRCREQGLGECIAQGVGWEKGARIGWLLGAKVGMETGSK